MKRLLLLFMLLLAGTSALVAQRTITGTVTDEKAVALIGATLVVKGTSVGTATDVDGSFRLQVPADAKTLVISYTGFQSQEVEIGASDVVNISLLEGIILDEAVVTAFGVKRDKSNLGYAVAEVSSRDLTVARTTNVTNALAGKIPGVRISGSGGSFTGSSIIIRGFTTFTGSNQPLFVVDGIPIDNSGGGTPLQNGPALSNRAIDLNQEDIESISVLKGAGATALYGSRAAGGVILITTKRGSVGQKSSVTYSASYNTQEVNRLPDYQNEYGQGSVGVYNPTAISSFGPRINGQSVILAPDYRGKLISPNDSVALTAFPDNVSDIFRSGYNMQHNLAFQGGSDKSAYRLSVGYLDDQGVLDNNRLQRYNFGINTSTALTSKLTAGVAANFVNTASDRTQQGNQLSNPLFRAYFLPRSLDLTGLPFETATGSQLNYDPAVDNPYWTIKNNLFDDNVSRFYGNFNLRYQLLNWLSAEYRLGVDYYSFRRSGYDQIGARGGANTSANTAGGILEGRDISSTLNSYLTLTGNRQIGQDFDLTFVLGQETTSDKFTSSQVIGRGVTVRDFRDLDANTTTYVPAFGISEGRIIGVFGNITTVFRNFATIDISVRNDWNSTLPKASNNYLYYSVAGTLNLTQAFPSIKSDALSLAKIRANYGRTGRASERYSTDSYFFTANPADGFGPNIQFPFNTLPGFTLGNTAGNPNLEPEFTTTFEVGLDLSVWKDRITLELTRYNSKSTGVILAVPNSSAAGIAAVVRNAGDLETDGWEVGLTIAPVRSKNFSWATTFNFTQFKSVVGNLAPGVQNIFLGGFVTPNIRLVEGDEYGQIYGNAYKRNADGVLLLTANGLPQPTANVEKLGNPNPDWTLGINNNFSFKGLTLNVLLDIREGGDIYSRNIADLQRNGVAAETAEFDRFNADGTEGTPYKFEGIFEAGPNAGQVNGGDVEKRVTAQQYWGNAGKYVAAEGFIYGTSWFRIREASLSYALPKSWLDKSPFGGLELGVFGRNLFLKAPDYPHLDPEQNALGISNAQGLEFNALPQMRSIGVNLRATF
ncbi:MAG: SusC/RagA family TonB-linked outer membrane protein [Saprospiraceae bacterium]|nr:SusC/RagA family TonB-linked outer membrane protein [Saprospiraceae bacterium]MDZ4704439.1 SusC/RagA family TonB-linked outer membrane protein [Saprospiraceae bacterium]